MILLTSRDIFLINSSASLFSSACETVSMQNVEKNITGVKSVLFHNQIYESGRETAIGDIFLTLCSPIMKIEKGNIELQLYNSSNIQKQPEIIFTLEDLSNQQNTI